MDRRALRRRGRGQRHGKPRMRKRRNARLKRFVARSKFGGGGSRLTYQRAEYWQRRAFTAGLEVGRVRTAGDAAAGEERAEIHRRWLAWNSQYRLHRLSWDLYMTAARAFVKGYAETSKARCETFLPLPGEYSVAVIVSVMNEEETLPDLLQQLDRLPLTEKIFVVNGSTDESFSILRSRSDGIVVHYAEALGHDVGRAIGARLATSEILLFLDGDIVIAAEKLVPFIQMVADGRAIALNDITPYLGVFAHWDHVTVMKAMLNRVLARPDLKANSLTAVPHAISREAAHRIGLRMLAIPPLAHYTAIHLGLKIGTAGSIDVVTANKLRRSNTGAHNAVANLIVGDHLEALSAAIANRGVRLGFADTIRKRDRAGGASA